MDVLTNSFARNNGQNVSPQDENAYRPKPRGVTKQTQTITTTTYKTTTNPENTAYQQPKTYQQTVSYQPHTNGYSQQNNPYNFQPQRINTQATNTQNPQTYVTTASQQPVAQTYTTRQPQTVTANQPQTLPNNTYSRQSTNPYAYTRPVTTSYNQAQATSQQHVVPNQPNAYLTPNSQVVYKTLPNQTITYERKENFEPQFSRRTRTLQDIAAEQGKIVRGCPHCGKANTFKLPLELTRSFAVRCGYCQGKFVCFPTQRERKLSEENLVKEVLNAKQAQANNTNKQLAYTVQRVPIPDFHNGFPTTPSGCSGQPKYPSGYLIHPQLRPPTGYHRVQPAPNRDDSAYRYQAPTSVPNQLQNIAKASV